MYTPGTRIRGATLVAALVIAFPLLQPQPAQARTSEVCVNLYLAEYCLSGNSEGTICASYATADGWGAWCTG